ncbi:malto-oligosyltrehalose trehalohydrolase [Pseudomonas syringae pv. syringae PD2774]|uniref:malto-oligosyltrehalose trehalohydrolase n=1 Tax=Pseudomonas syringae TaxID=317 RepID=UPI000735F22D|nr:malto-oligosyltrehalose trehalohydrolase [Pseudomonas syringae pv. syringae PD2774]
MHMHNELYRRHGAIVLDTNRTRFSLWGPDAETAEVVTGDGQSTAMLRNEDGWFILEANCPTGTLYKYKINDDLEVPDPASRAQATDVYGFSVVVDSNAHCWQQSDWKGRPWHEAIIYELHVGLLGGYSAVAAMLPGLAEIGFTAIELMPLAQFSGDRNWGYDGVLPYAPQSSYGSPEELKSLIDTAHGLRLAVIIDVVYNHFGPDGNYLNTYAKQFYHSDKKTPWGDAIDYSRREVRDFLIDNALMWLSEYRFDGLRLDAVHAIEDPTFLDELSGRVREKCEEPRQVWLILENELNEAHRLTEGFDAQWNDDGHNTLHVLLTGETDSYYADFAEATIQKLARVLREGFVYQGSLTCHGKARGEPSGYLPPSAFVLFLQNHDQVGNRALGERLVHITPAPALRAATALLLLSPMIPLIFMGDEWGAAQPFLFFTDFHDELAAKVCEGRRREFEDFAAFADHTQRERIPDPDSECTFQKSKPAFDAPNREGDSAKGHRDWLQLYTDLLAIRRREIIPRMHASRALDAQVLGDKSVSARWRMGDGSTLQIDLNLGEESVPILEQPTGKILFEMPNHENRRTVLDSFSVVVTLG